MLNNPHLSFRFVEYVSTYSDPGLPSGLLKLFTLFDLPDQVVEDEMVK